MTKVEKAIWMISFGLIGVGAFVHYLEGTPRGTWSDVVFMLCGYAAGLATMLAKPRGTRSPAIKRAQEDSKP